jgi:hypothetical protein
MDMTNAAPTYVYREGFIVDAAGIAMPTRRYMGTMVAQAKLHKSISKAADKVQGSLYVQYEERQAKDASDDTLSAIIEENLRLYYADYVSRLSTRAKRTIAHIIACIDQEVQNSTVDGDLQAEEHAVSRVVDTEEGKCFSSYRNWEHKDTLNCKDYWLMMYRYMPDDL